jgi:hypothetical protein
MPLPPRHGVGCVNVDTIARGGPAGFPFTSRLMLPPRFEPFEHFELAILRYFLSAAYRLGSAPANCESVGRSSESKDYVCHSPVATPFRRNVP